MIKKIIETEKNLYYNITKILCEKSVTLKEFEEKMDDIKEKVADAEEEIREAMNLYLDASNPKEPPIKENYES